MGVGVGALEIREGEARLIASSSWAERGFCAACGSGLFYRLTIAGKYQGITSVALGVLDDPSGISVVNEWFIDRKPEAYALAGELRCFTEAQAMAMLNEA